MSVKNYLMAITLLGGILVASGENLLYNADFRLIANPRQPDGWGTGHWGVMNIDSEQSIKAFSDEWQLLSSGEFKIIYQKNSTGPGKNFVSIWTSLPETDVSYVFAADIRSSETSGKIRLEIIDARGKRLKGEEFTVNNQSKRYSVSQKIRQKRVRVRITPLTSGEYYLKNPQLEIGETPSDFVRDTRYDQEPPAIDLQQTPTRIKLQTQQGKIPTETTEVELNTDQENLYITFSCRSTTPLSELSSQWEQKVKRGACLPNSGEDRFVWRAPDSVSIFLSPYSDGSNYYRFSADRMGYRFDSQADNPAWDGNWKFETVEVDDGWRATFTIPLSLLPAGDTVWRANFCRENNHKPENSAWNPTYGYFNRNKYFGKITGLRGTGRFPAISIPKSRPFMHNGEIFIPYAYCYERGNFPKISDRELQYLRSLNFNTITLHLNPNEHSTTEIIKFLDHVHKAGFKIGFALWARKMDFELLRKAYDELIPAIAGHPAVWRFTAMDEPELWGGNPEYQTKVYQWLKKLAPNTPVNINYTANQRQDIPNMPPGDFVSMDHYPVPDTDIKSIPAIADALGQVGKSVFFYLQTSGSAYFASREPTPLEYQWMVFSSIVRGGVSGFGLFAQLPHNPELHREIKECGRRLILMRPFWESQWTASSLQGAWSLASDRHILVVNPDQQPRTANLSGSKLARDLFTGEVFTTANIPLAPYQSRFLETEGK